MVNFRVGLGLRGTARVKVSGLVYGLVSVSITMSAGISFAPSSFLWLWPTLRFLAVWDFGDPGGGL